MGYEDHLHLMLKVLTDVAITLEIAGCMASTFGIESNSLHSLHLHGARVDLKLSDGVGSELGCLLLAAG
jgi:hypothetical protein